MRGGHTPQVSKVGYTLVFDSGKYTYFPEHQLWDGFGMTASRSPLNTWICRSGRCDPRTSLPRPRPSTRGKRSKVGQWLAAVCTHGLCLLPLNLPRRRVPSPPGQCHCLTRRLSRFCPGSSSAAQGRAPSGKHSAGRLVRRSRQNHHPLQLLCVVREALALPLCCPSSFCSWRLTSCC